MTTKKETYRKQADCAKSTEGHVFPGGGPYGTCTKCGMVVNAPEPEAIAPPPRTGDATTRVVVERKAGLSAAELAEALRQPGVVAYWVTTKGVRRPVVSRLTIEVSAAYGDPKEVRR